ncbi:uncharacterized protein SPSK_09971 [Sporothrix schenckii 1099-18]|uniref:Uncharacterized protein n=1 Tax=Sporothrix schenckii 1099-18 TaxID=1397361 RepID=A0A0F2MC42_SPOSC|nr:uncharacterized protein SPSK_09971 [Sporothrix schenckii 1099-18]KJR85726.1 hypothetical protein SPSK_09971 [Sporothrix schenckii 1099-18]
MQRCKDKDARGRGQKGGVDRAAVEVKPKLSQRKSGDGRGRAGSLGGSEAWEPQLVHLGLFVVVVVVRLRLCLLLPHKLVFCRMVAWWGEAKSQTAMYFFEAGGLPRKWFLAGRQRTQQNFVRPGGPMGRRELCANATGGGLAKVRSLSSATRH